MKHKISAFSTLCLFIAAFMLVISLFFPIWKIELDAPQYPEGLELHIWANRIAGDVDVINGLNHYIGMKTLHSDDFVEFRILPYIIGVYALIFLLNAIVRSKKMLYFVLAAFILFGIVAMVDFWLWEYNYGHDLDPNAAIKVPGMAYQPPLIGFKQLLNFGAYSIPHTGGWLFIGSGVLVLIAVLNESGILNKKSQRKNVARNAIVANLFILLFSSCSSDQPDPIRINSDDCDFCRMTISDGRFGAEVVTNKGRVYKFDDFSCLKKFVNEQGNAGIKKYYIADYTKDNTLIDATGAWYVHDDELKSPMLGNIAAFSSREDAAEYSKKNDRSVSNWTEMKVVAD